INSAPNPRPTMATLTFRALMCCQLARNGRTHPAVVVRRIHLDSAQLSTRKRGSSGAGYVPAPLCIGSNRMVTALATEAADPPPGRPDHQEAPDRAEDLAVHPPPAEAGPDQAEALRLLQAGADAAHPASVCRLRSYRAFSARRWRWRFRFRQSRHHGWRRGPQ